MERNNAPSVTEETVYSNDYSGYNIGNRMVNMKIVLSVLLSLAVIGCFIFGVAFTSTRSDLNQAETQLANAHTELTDTQNQLAGVNTELAQTRTELTDTKTDLTKTRADLHTASEDLSATESELSTTKFSLIDVTTERDTALAKNVAFIADYSSLRDQINTKAGQGKHAQLYFSPNDPDVAAKTLAVAGVFSQNNNEFWADYQRLYQWVVDNIEYNYDTNIPFMPTGVNGNIKWFADYWKMPSETLTDKRGDCEDMAYLLASMLLSYNGGQYGVWTIEIHNNDSGHIAVAVPVKGHNLVILDPAGKYYSGMNTMYIQSNNIAAAINTWLAHWSNEMPGAEITAVYGADFYKEFAGTQEFIQWAIDRYKD